MAKTYQSKIVFDSDLLQGGDKTSWEDGVEKSLDTLWSSLTGRAVLNQIIASDKAVKIVPYYGSEQNASAQPRDHNASYYKDRPVRDGSGNLIAGGGAGTGQGSDVRMNYTPWRFSTSLRCIVLIHELAHAAEMQRGVLFGNAMQWHFDSAAEFDAIVVENIYRSEKSQIIRESHHGVNALPGTRMIPHGGELKARLDSFRARMPGLTAALAGIAVPFNPLRPGAQGSK